eukprot:NODE_22134_length_721_cov_3.749158.p2 GENE.NODE_22134_length_721_cov_3.749158~~NODE_22134_length_721_cov_3.749158.p2  ORF type:complete len:149 (-),score=46.72 NODE_22134_length_721_cov_3.749158:274-720(-)
MFDEREDFASPLELSTRGGAKLVENVVSFVSDHPASVLRRRQSQLSSGGGAGNEGGGGDGGNGADEDVYLPPHGSMAIQMGCCGLRTARRRVYANKEVQEAAPDPIEQQALSAASASAAAAAAAAAAVSAQPSRTTEYTETQQHWLRI